MTETTKPGHRIEEVVSYRDGLLGEAERAAFEAHLAGCAACRADLAAAEVVLSGLRDRMARGIAGGYSTAEILARMKRKEAELERAPARLQWPIWAGLGVAAAAALLALALALRSQPTAAPRQEIAVPERKPPKAMLMAPRAEPDAGPDAGARAPQGAEVR